MYMCKNAEVGGWFLCHSSGAVHHVETGLSVAYSLSNSLGWLASRSQESSLLSLLSTGIYECTTNPSLFYQGSWDLTQKSLLRQAEHFSHWSNSLVQSWLLSYNMKENKIYIRTWNENNVKVWLKIVFETCQSIYVKITLKRKREHFYSSISVMDFLVLVVGKHVKATVNYQTVW